MDNQSPTLNGLAAKITELSAEFTKYLKENNVPEPTFAADSPTSYSNLTPGSFVLRQKLSDALMDMWYLTQGPSESIFNYVHCVMPDVAVLNILNRFDFWSAVPLNGSASYEEIAQHTSLPEEVVRRVLEHATTLRIFAETESESESEHGKPASPHIQHTSRSAAVARSAGLSALVSTVLDDAGPPMSVMNEALEKHNRGKTVLHQDMSQTAFTWLHGGKYANTWEYIEDDGEGERKGWRQRNFVEFMNYIKEIFQLEKVVLNSYDWKAAGKATVVDVGGSGGHDDMVLARNFPDLSITVQDLPAVRPKFDAARPADLASRLSFMEHNFFDPQPIHADVYLIKLILHDWPDREAVRILQALVPAMKPGARVVFVDYVGKQGGGDQDEGLVEGGGLPRSIRQMGTATDLRMMALFAAKERPAEAWKHIFRAADERFEVVRVDADPLTFMVVMEAVWRG